MTAKAFWRPFVSPLALSLVLHGLIAAGLFICENFSRELDERARFDVMRVELVIADETEERSAVADVSPRTHATRPTESKVVPSLSVLTSEPLEAVVSQNAEGKGEGPQGKVEEPEAKGEETEVNREALQDNCLAEKRDTIATPAAGMPQETTVATLARPLHGIRPEYPRTSRRRGEQGEVILEINVDANGGVASVRVSSSSGFPRLDEAAVKAAKGTRFTPGKVGGVSVASTVCLKLDFKLK